MTADRPSAALNRLDAMRYALYLKETIQEVMGKALAD